MARRILVHIGPAKTGTSSLQETLYAARESLSAQGYAYSPFGRHDQMPRAAGHHGLPAVLKTGAAMPDELVQWIHALPPEHVVILSSENFAHLSTAQITAFVAQLGAGQAVPPQIEVIYYARRWDKLMPSVWQELVKHGECRPYLTFLNQQMAAPRASLYLNYGMVLERWATACGGDNIHLFSFDNLKSQGHDIISHFSQEVLGLARLQASPRGSNASWQVSSTEILRLLNVISFGNRQGDPSVRTRFVKAQALVADEIAEIVSLLDSYVQECRPCAPLVLHAVEHDVLQKFGARLGNPTPDGRLFELSSFAQATYVDGNFWLLDRPRVLLRDIHRKLDLPDPLG